MRGRARELSDVQWRLVTLSPAVDHVRGDRIYLTDGFRVHLLARLDAGDSPSRVFAEAGLPSSVIGGKRIERAAYKVRHNRSVRERLDRDGDVWEPDVNVSGLMDLRSRVEHVRVEADEIRGELDSLLAVLAARSADRLEEGA